jgi:cytochrome P450
MELNKQWGINDKNFVTFSGGLKDMIKESRDKNSVLSIIRKSGEFTEEDIFHDLIMWLNAGTETSSHALTATFFFLKKYPIVFAKVKKELEEHGIKNGKDLRDAITIDSINKLDYLTCVIKEVFRYDTVIADTFDYGVMQDVEICGVPISKGTRMKIDIMTAHHNDDAWL